MGAGYRLVYLAHEAVRMPVAMWWLSPEKT
jgi:hypothetical protein